MIEKDIEILNTQGNSYKLLIELGKQIFQEMQTAKTYQELYYLADQENKELHKTVRKLRFDISEIISGKVEDKIEQIIDTETLAIDSKIK